MIDETLEKLLTIPQETQTIEFKRLNGKAIVSKIIETIVAMANADGGILILGIDDPETTKLKGLERVFGIEENIDLYDEIGREIQRIVTPIPKIFPAHLISVNQTGKRIAYFTIPKVTDHFRSINNKVYVRQQKSNKLLNPQEIIHFAYVKGFEKADRELVDVEFNLLNTSYYQDWKNNRNLSGTTVQEILEKTGLARKHTNGDLLPTRAAVLLFAEYPTNLMETKCVVRIFQYTGRLETISQTPNLIGTPITLHGPLIKLIRDAHNQVLTLLRSGVRIPSGFTTQYILPERAVKEAITNAVIHRDYFTKRDIEIKIFEDRLEIENPGLFPYNITPSNIGYVRSEGYRNDLLVKHLREFSSPPNLDQNEGIKAMRHEMHAENLYPPIFVTYPHLQDAVRVVLFNEKVASEWEKVNFYLSTNRYITNDKAREITNITQRDKMSKMLHRWVKRGLLVQIKPKSGYVKGTKYRLQGITEI